MKNTIRTLDNLLEEVEELDNSEELAFEIEEYLCSHAFVVKEPSLITISIMESLRDAEMFGRLHEVAEVLEQFKIM